MHADDFKQLPPRYSGTAEEVAPIDTKMPNAMTVEGYIAGIGRMAQVAVQPGRRRRVPVKIGITLITMGMILGALSGFIHTIWSSFG